MSSASLIFGACKLNDDSLVGGTGYSVGHTTDDCQEIDPKHASICVQAISMADVVCPFTVYQKIQFAADELDQQWSCKGQHLRN
jgi:hypothetical protein